MGGFGSGRFGYRASKNTTGDFAQLSVSYLKRNGLLCAGTKSGMQWSRRGNVFSSIRFEISESYITLIYRYRVAHEEWEDMRYVVLLDRTPCNYGGFRVWFRCPAVSCGRRVAVLYGGKVFACRHCYRLAYPVQRENLADRLARRADRIRDRLGWEPGILNPDGNKPKGMHWSTYARLHVQHCQYVIQSLHKMEEILDRSESRLLATRLHRN